MSASSAAVFPPRSSPRSWRSGGPASPSRSWKRAGRSSTSLTAWNIAGDGSTTARNPWPGDVVRDQEAQNVISRTMAVGGSALHWGGVTNRFSEEDLRLRSRYGLAVDWPLAWDELEHFYCEAERRIGVAGEPSPLPE